MKRTLLFLICVIYSALTTAKVTIEMEKEGGVYKVPCIVNGLRMRFIFDTGAANVCISETMANYMLENDYLQKEDKTIAKGDEKLQFKVIEFSKENKKIVVSHLRTWQAEEPKRDEKNEASSVKKINEGLEKTTLGDLEVLATLKEEMEKNEK